MGARANLSWASRICQTGLNGFPPPPSAAIRDLPDAEKLKLDADSRLYLEFLWGGPTFEFRIPRWFSTTAVFPYWATSRELEALKAVYMRAPGPDDDPLVPLRCATCVAPETRELLTLPNDMYIGPHRRDQFPIGYRLYDCCNLPPPRACLGHPFRADIVHWARGKFAEEMP